MNIAIVGTVGVPARYGGFETLAENLARHHHNHKLPEKLIVYCSCRSYPDKPSQYLSTWLRYSHLDANGAQSVLYDAVALLDAVFRKTDVIILLGVSGAIALPLIRLVSSARIISNIDGIEWRRDKWKGLARWFLRLSERLAVRFSHEVIADNQAIADYARETYGITAEVIEYGGDHAIEELVESPAHEIVDLPEDYALALCRIEPENNVAMILEAFVKIGQPLVFVGNWNNSAYSRQLRTRFFGQRNLHLLDPIYDPGPLRRIRSGAWAYVHGHSAGGTNPALVEMMHFGIPIYAFDCVYNRHTTEDQAIYFASAEELARLVEAGPSEGTTAVGASMREIAQRRYTWDRISQRYFDLIRSVAHAGDCKKSERKR